LRFYCPVCGNRVKAKKAVIVDGDSCKEKYVHPNCMKDYNADSGGSGIASKDLNWDVDGTQVCSECGLPIRDDDDDAVQQVFGFGFGDVEEEEYGGWVCGKCHEKRDRDLFKFYSE